MGKALLRWCGCILCALLTGVSPASALQRDGYANPVSKGFADTFADPSVIRGKDGFWYAFATSDPLREGEGDYHLLPTARSRDLVHWRYVGDAFEASNAPSWMATPEVWAPDVRYIDGRYLLYYVVTDTTVSDADFDNAIGVATAPTPTGPWRDSGAPLVGPRSGPSGEPDDYLWTFDPSLFTDEDGTRYLYFGSYYGGIFVTELTDDGLKTVGEPKMVAIDNRYEGAYVVRRGRYYYLFASSGACCAGPTSGYTVFVGRAKSPLGPFRDRDGIRLTASRVGGTIVAAPNGNKWVGTGHNAVVTDLSGRDWLAYHGISRFDPFLDEPYGVNERPMLIDRLDWIDGWPTVRAGRWASQLVQRAPVGKWTLGEVFDASSLDGGAWRAKPGRWRFLPDEEVIRGKAGSCREAYLTSTRTISGALRVEADLRLRDPDAAIGLVAGFRDRDHLVVAWIDGAFDELLLSIVQGGALVLSRARLPASFSYDELHNVALEMRGATVRAEVTDARLNDPVATVRAPNLAPTDVPGSIGVAVACGAGEAAGVGASPLHDRAVTPARLPAVGRVDPALSDEFDGNELEPQWSWVRAAQGEVVDGVFRWPTQDGDLYKRTNDASVLLRPAPRGRYTVETKLAIDLGVNTVRNHQQAGLVAYVHDDLNIRLDHSAIFNTRQTEFGKEMPFRGRLSYGAMAVGSPRPVTWLRMSHRVDPDSGKHELRAGSSRDGVHWTWGGTWTLPPGRAPRVGLVSMGGTGATAEFEYFRAMRP
jgi:arabinan endo-1,5-alpha-L-arabinosidase